MCIDSDKPALGDDGPRRLQQGIEGGVTVADRQPASVQPDQILLVLGCDADSVGELRQRREVIEEVLSQVEPGVSTLADDAAQLFRAGTIEKCIKMFREIRYLSPAPLRAA
jgi:hypothetical protein